MSRHVLGSIGSVQRVSRSDELNVMDQWHYDSRGGREGVPNVCNLVAIFEPSPMSLTPPKNALSHTQSQQPYARLCRAMCAQTATCQLLGYVSHTTRHMS